MTFDAFSREFVALPTGRVLVRRAGSGPAVLLLHGFPETSVAWRNVAPGLAKQFTVVAADLPGYGDSILSDSAIDEGRVSKRTMGAILADAMTELDIPTFAVVGHDRGARVAYRMALDHPGCVERLAVLDVVPTLDMAEQCSYELASNLVNWFFLAQSAPLPERLITAAGDLYINEILDRWLGPSAALDPRAREAYLVAFRDPAVVHTVCEEYRAGSTVDILHDRDDRETGRQLACPVLALWSADDLAGRFFDPLATWRKWATNVQGRAISAGHFLMEEAPDIVGGALMTFLTGNE